jgi:hypothetical protein
MPGSEQDCGDGAADAYDVILSFSPQDRKSVDILALELARRGIRIFRDETPEAVAWGARLGASIPPPQGVRSRYVIVQLEPEKARGLWGAGEAGEETAPADPPVADPSISYLCCPPESVSTIADRVSRELRRVAARTVPRIWRVPMGDGTRPGQGVPVFEDKPPRE